MGLRLTVRAKSNYLSKDQDVYNALVTRCRFTSLNIACVYAIERFNNRDADGRRVRLLIIVCQAI